MKKIITTVGTSIFTNHFDGINRADLQKVHDGLKDGFPSNRWLEKAVQKNCDKLRTEVKKFWESDQASSEISSLLKIAKQYKSEELEVYLIATDTVLSRLAAELVQEWFGERMTIHFNPKAHVISGLSIEQATTFVEQGIQGLVQAILDIQGKDETEGSTILNISGGYKGLIPIMTIVGQLYNMSICYTYEDSDELIEIQHMPLNFDWEIIEQYSTPLLRPQRMTIEEGEALWALHLAIEKEGRYTLTLLGTLISQYLKRNPPHFGTQFGYFIEYKLKEYFDEQLGCQQVLHGYKPQKYDKAAPDGDVDLALLDGAGGVIAIEIKPFELLSDPQKLMGCMENFLVRAISLGFQKNLKIKELQLFTYGFQQERSTKEFPVLNADQQVVLTQVAESIKKELLGVKFICNYVLVTRNKVSHRDRIPHKKFLEGSIKPDQIHTLFLS